MLVHGIGVSSRYFRPLAAELIRYGTVYLVDLPGYGASPKPRAPVSLADHVTVLTRFLEDRGMRAPVLVGHSMGTQLVTRLAADRPDLTDRLVLLGATMRPEMRTVAAASWLLLRDILREPPAANRVVVIDYLFRCGIPYYLAQLPNLLDDAIEDRLHRVAAKTLVLSGDRDAIAPADWSRRVASLLPAGRYLPVCGPHVVMFSDPVRLAALIAEHARS